MKKLALALVCLVSVAFFASCTPDPIEPVVEHPEPTIAIIAGEGYITGTPEEPQIISTDDTIDWTFGFHIESNAQTKKELSKLVVLYSLKGEYEADTTITVDLAGKTSFDYYDPLSNRVIVSETTVTATVTDVDGKVNTAAIAFKFDQPAMPLDVNPFTWTREGSYPGEGLEMFGLKWTRNLKETFAVIEPIDDEVILYKFADPSVWNEVETDLDLAALFSDGTQATVIKDYRGVSAWSSQRYNDLIATYVDGEYFLIHITRGIVEGPRGTNISIEGEYKN